MMASDHHSQVLKTPASPPPMSQSQLPSGFFLTQITLRILALAFTVAAISLMVTSGQSVFIYGVVFQARFSYSFAFRYKVGADAAVCALSLLSLILVCAMSRPKSNPSSHFFLFLHDLVLLVLTISGCAAATAIGYVGRFGKRRQKLTKQYSIKGKSTSFTLRVLESPAPTTSSSSQRRFFKAQLALRVLAIAFTSAAIIMMVKSKESVSILGTVLQARYTYSSAFRFKLGADAVVCTLSLFSLIPLYVFSRPKSDPRNYFYLLLPDLIFMVLMISGCAAATAIGYVGHHGQSQTGWMPICGQVNNFCDKVMLSIVSSYLAFLCFLVLTIMAAYKLKSRATK
ncbi:hypothetical protein RJ639_028871 [Escallonia herrerae]|uniref:CASP-like protein n=1 Tax=Escallonia herrerae TaxID=1293975 RepID=A0AA88XHV0_9ASTE|nr:hypothetical protein RJ639_028871 [Escallonia herrerae]